jgi:rubrerythrin
VIPSGITTAFTPNKPAFSGAKRLEERDATYVRPHACPRCSGMGYIWRGEETEDCPVCKGKGTI